MANIPDHALGNLAVADNGDGSYTLLTMTAAQDSAGGALPSNFDGLAQALTYNGDATVATIAKTNGINTWTQTLTYVAGNLTGISAWVRS